MNLHISTILFLIFEHINRIFTQGIPMSPCPKLFQYRFDGTEWYGILSVRNPDFGEALHLRITLSLRGKPTTNYIGEIELLTRGQYMSNSPVLYKVKFPKNHLPPKVLQIMVNSQVVCVGNADHSIFVTQIILEHTRKFTFMPEDSSMQLTPDLTGSLSAVANGGASATSHTGLPTHQLADNDDFLLPTNTDFGTRHLPLANFQKQQQPKHDGSTEICGKIDERIRFQVLPSIKSFQGRSEHINPNGGAEVTGRRSASGTVTAGDGIILPALVTSITDENEEFKGHPDELPSIARGAWPWLAAIYVNNLTSLAYQCGGTLISSHVVISSAHCFHLFQKRYTANEVLVFLGRHNLKNWNEEGSLAAPVDDIFTHPDYDSHLNTYDADIAVVMLKNKVRYNTFIRPACMWSGPTHPQYIEGELGILIGWGFSANSRDSLHLQPNTAIPRIINAPIVPKEVCYQSNKQFHSLSSNRTLCAGALQTSTTKLTAATPSKFIVKGPCTGDSGTGLMIFKNNRWVLRGIVSGSLPSAAAISSKNIPRNCNVHSYVIYTDVAKFLDWIFAFII